MSTPNVEIYAIQYADSRYYADQLFAIDDTTDPEFGKGTEFVDFNWLFYVVKTPNKVILIDTGFTTVEPLKRWGMGELDGKEFVVHDTEELLAAVGIKLSDVTDVILTHHDFDHVGGMHLFSHAHVHMNKEALGVLLSDEGAKIDTPKVVADLGARSGNLTVFDDAYEFEGITVRRIGGHTPGSCVAELTVGDATYVFVADECYVLENAEEGKPIGYRIGDKSKNVAFVHEMKKRINEVDSSGSQKHKLMKEGSGKKLVILPFHEPRVMQQFPHVGGNKYVVKVV